MFLFRRLIYKEGTIMRVLLVEDDPDILKVASLALRFDGRFHVLQASSGSQGLALARKEQPDLVVLDVMMPDMDGYETLKRLKADEATSEIPVVFLTARAQEPEMRKGLVMGAVGYLVKPFDPMQLPGKLLELMHP
jgi:two-component system OmpR family response regulator